jgi:hypothetical protein
MTPLIVCSLSPGCGDPAPHASRETIAGAGEDTPCVHPSSRAVVKLKAASNRAAADLRSTFKDFPEKIVLLNWEVFHAIAGARHVDPVITSSPLTRNLGGDVDPQGAACKRRARGYIASGLASDADR